MANKYCSKCGAEMPEGAMFCTKCGKPYDEDDTMQSKREHKVNKKTVYALVGILGLLILIVFGSMFYSEYEEAQEARLAREKFVADSLEQARKDSIKLAELKEKERIEAEKARQKKEMLIPIEVVLDLFKSNNNNYIKSKLDEYGYTFFADDDNYEYFSKKVKLKGVEDWRGDVYYEPTERKGSRAMLSKSNEYFYFGITVFSKEDFVEWVKQLKKLGYKEESYGEDLPMENGWTALGAHGNLCKMFCDGKGNSVEFMKDGDGHIGYSVYSVE